MRLSIPLVLATLLCGRVSAANPNAPAQATPTPTPFNFVVEARGVFSLVTEGPDDDMTKAHLLFPNASRLLGNAAKLSKVAAFLGGETPDIVPDHYTVITIANKYFSGDASDKGTVDIPVLTKSTETAVVSTDLPCSEKGIKEGKVLDGIPYLPRIGEAMKAADPPLAGTDSRVAKAATGLLTGASPSLAARFTFGCGETASVVRVKDAMDNAVSVAEAFITRNLAPPPTYSVSDTSKPAAYYRPVFTKKDLALNSMKLLINSREFVLRPADKEIRITIRSAPADEILEGSAHRHTDWDSSYTHSRWNYLLTDLSALNFSSQPIYVLKKYPVNAGGDPFCNSQRRLKP